MSLSRHFPEARSFLLLFSATDIIFLARLPRVSIISAAQSLPQRTPEQMWCMHRWAGAPLGIFDRHMICISQPKPAKPGPGNHCGTRKLPFSVFACKKPQLPAPGST